jgi:nitrate/nitrite-specific signal transduction histidine kinase
MNMAMCHSFAERFSVDTKDLLERVAKQITGQEALQLIQRIREALHRMMRC